MGLRRALERGTLSLHYQPEVEAVSKQVRALEALLRWELPGARAVPPNEFIAIAEDCGLIFPIGEFALRRACEDCLTWQRDGLSGVRVAVNLSPVQLQRQPIVELVARVLGETGLPPSLLELELTETAVIADLAAVTRTLEGLKSLGVRLALDDFGTGYSALAYLRRLPLDALKIDREFITDVGTNPAATAIVAAITAVADRLGLEVVAEGVETQLQERIAREEGCNLLQGFRFARPAPISQLMAQLVATGGGPRAVAANT
jgi:EAL domain-containing protein (putative c-di-GMP-specific phosphodiesterase class I)